MKKIILIVLSLVLSGSVISGMINKNTTYAMLDNSVGLLSYSTKSKTTTYDQTDEYIYSTTSGGVNKFGLKYIIKVYCAATFNENTYKVTKITGPKLTIVYSDLKNSFAQAYDVVLDNQHNSVTYNNNKTSANFSWSFDVKVAILGKKYYFTKITGSTTLKL